MVIVYIAPLPDLSRKANDISVWMNCVFLYIGTNADSCG